MRAMVPMGVLSVCLGCASGDVDTRNQPATYEEIFVSKNDVNRGGVNLEVRSIEVRAGESVAQALARAGVRAGSLDDLVEEARRAGPGVEADSVPENAPPASSDACNNNCNWANDGVCDDGSDPQGTSACAPDTDCNDCKGNAQPPAMPDQPQPPAEAGCDTCQWSNDGVCDDGSDPRGTSACAAGTDCTDCAQSPSPEAEPPAPEAEPPAPNGCNNSCQWAHDGICDEPDICSAGTDCDDCRAGGNPEAEPPAPEAEPPAPEAEPPAPEAEPPAPDPNQCDNSCQWANDGVCDDPAYCDPGTDCNDCRNPVNPADPPDQPPAQPDAPLDQERVHGGCNDSCTYSNDGTCDDGRPGAPYGVCARGTDCSDCDSPGGMAMAPNDMIDEPDPDDELIGHEMAHPPQQGNGSPSDSNVEQAGGQTCVANGRDGVCGPSGDCHGTPVPGFCPGPPGIQCCVSGGPVGDDGSGADDTGAEPNAPNMSLPAEGQACLATGQPGVCENTATCDGTPIPGHCAGNSSIQCCVPDGIEDKAACAGICIAAGVIVWGGRLLLYAVRSPPVARQVVVTTVRQTASNGARTQVTVRATDQAINALSATTAVVAAETINPTIGPAMERLRRDIARGDSQARPDARAETHACQASPALNACVDRARARVQGGGGTLGESTCSDAERQQYNSRMHAVCDDGGQLPLSCEHHQDIEAQARRYIRDPGDFSAADMAGVLNHCQQSRWRMRNRQRCKAARQKVIDECFPGDRGDDTHRCAVCQQQSGIEECEDVLSKTFCTDIENAFQ